MNDTLQTFAEYTAARRAAAAADIREHGGEKDRFSAVEKALRKMIGLDHQKLKKYLPTGEDYGLKYRGNVFKYFNHSPESQKLKMIELEAPVYKILSQIEEFKNLSEPEKRLAARAAAFDLFRELGKASQTITNATANETKHKSKTKEVLLSTLWAEVEREKAQGFDFEQISGMLKAITKDRLIVGASKIADEYYKRHPEARPNKKAAQ